MTKLCEGCGKPLEAKDRRRRFHNDACRMRKNRAQVIPIRSKPEASRGSVETAARAELDELGATESLLGQTVLALAARIDVGNETGAATAALAKEMRATMTEASVGARRVASPVDQLRQKRLERMGSGA